jgi:hypothetical protein
METEERDGGEREEREKREKDKKGEIEHRN